MASRIELMLASDQDLSTETRDDLLILQKNIERASRISHSLLSIARQRPGARYATDMNVAVEKAMLIVGPETRGDAIRYETRLDRSLPEVMGEPTGLEQVLVNLILNARDAGARLIRIETAPAPGRAGHLRCCLVSDDGLGNQERRARETVSAVLHDQAKGTAWACG